MSFVRSVTSAHNGGNKMDLDHDSQHDSAYVSAESKRNSESSLYPIPPGGQPARFESPQLMEGLQHRSILTKAEDRDPRLSLMEHKADPPAPTPGDVSRASTLPVNLDSNGPALIMGDKLQSLIENSSKDSLLLLDIRSAQNYAASRIKGALNLCIPTTLLKRATFNIEKLQQTFQGSSESEQFSRWRKADVIVVYDSHASDHRDAVTAQNMIKKFTNEGYKGETCILKGGFTKFKETHPKLIDTGSPRKSAGTSSTNAHNGPMAPVIGGVSLPTAAGGANPFFSNIRQNMDLADGVGQFELKRPDGLTSPLLPTWLREAASDTDKGRQVSEKFLKIEKEEKSRMQLAYAAFDPHTAQQKQPVQLSGVEKGGKNRYKDILPFEHARVKLQEKPEGQCDYVNASHLKTSRSNKRYIASQGPLPATFEDFWSVVWEQDVRVLVMLTAESEGGQLKCHSYWKERDYGPLILKPLSEKKASLDIDKHRSDSSSFPGSSTMGETGRRRANTMTTLHTSAATPQPLKGQTETPHVIIRKFALSHAAYPFAPIREITQLHFPSWPDFGTPANPAHLLALVELANVMQRASQPVATSSIVGNRRASEHQLPITWHDDPEAENNTRPMLVHCSAGCGRTGSFCTVDSVIDMLKRQRQVKSMLGRKRDLDGDISMEESGDCVSPRTTKRINLGEASRQPSQASAVPQVDSTSVDTRWMNDDSVDLVQTAVEEFRQQRLSTVQSLRQFVLCYETILEWVHRMNDKGSTLGTGRARGNSFSQNNRQ